MLDDRWLPREDLTRVSPLVPSGQRSITFTLSSVTHVVTFDLDKGGSIVQFEREGTELLHVGPSNNRGIRAALVWVDEDVTGEFTHHRLTQGADLYGENGGIVTDYQVSGTATSPVVAISLVPVVSDPDGSQAQRFVSSYHGGSNTQSVWGHQFPFTVTWSFNYTGVVGLHRCDFVVDNQYGAITSAHFDMAQYMIGFFNTSAMPRLLENDDGLTNQLSNATSGVTGYQADFRRYMLDSAKLKGDDEADGAGLIAGRGAIEAGGPTSGSVAVGWGQTPSTDAKTGNRTLGDTPNGNGWSWMQNHGGTDGPRATNFVSIAYGSWLSSRIHADTSVRTMPSGNISLTSYFLTGTVDGLETTIESV